MSQKKIPKDFQEVPRTSFISDLSEEELRVMAQSEQAPEFIEKMKAGIARLEQHKETFQKKLKEYQR